MSAIDIMADDSLHTFQLVISHSPHDIQHLFGGVFILRMLSPIQMSCDIFNCDYNPIIRTER